MIEESLLITPPAFSATDVAAIVLSGTKCRLARKTAAAAAAATATAAATTITHWYRQQLPHRPYR